MGGRKSVGELVVIGVIAGLVAFGLAYSTRQHATSKAPARTATGFETREATFELHAAAGRVTVRSRDGALSRDFDLAAVVDGAVHPLAFARDDLRPSPGVLRALVSLPVGDTVVDATLE